MRSIEAITNTALRRVQQVIMAELPEPECSSKKQQWRWQVEQVKKKVANELWPENNGINIEVKV